MVSLRFTVRFRSVFTVFSQCFGVFAACFAFRRAFRARFRAGGEHFEELPMVWPYGGDGGGFLWFCLWFGLWSFRFSLRLDIVSGHRV